MKPRATLKDYFKKGAIPKESDFADLIDSMLVQDEDSILKLPNDPLSIKATGAEEALLNFYHVEGGNNTLTWQVKQKEADKTGLSIHDGAASRLFIEGGTGSIGIGTTVPHGQLQIVGPPIFDSSTILHLTNGATDHGRTNLVLTGRFNQGNDAWQFGSSARNSIVFAKNAKAANIDVGGLGVEQFSLQLEGNSNSLGFLTAQLATKPALVIQQDGNVGLGTTTPNDTLDIAGNLRVLTGSNPMRFTSVWSAFPDAVTNQAEISNDTGQYKTLMLVGNRSAGLGRRVSIWDRLEVNGNLAVTGNIGLGTQTPQHMLQIGEDVDGIGFTASDGSPNAGYIRFGDNTGWKLHVGRSRDQVHGNINAGLAGVLTTIQDTGEVGIGTTTPITKLQVAGEIYATGKVYCVGGIVIQGPQNKWRIHNGDGWNETSGPSDARLKKDVHVLPHALQKVLRLRGVAYKWNDLGLQRLSRFAETYDAGPGATEQEQLQLRAAKREEAYKQFSGTEIGLIAQEVRQVVPELVSEQADGYLGITYERVVALLVEAIKEQQAMIEALSAKSAVLPVA